MDARFNTHERLGNMAAYFPAMQFHAYVFQNARTTNSFHNANVRISNDRSLLFGPGRAIGEPCLVNLHLYILENEHLNAILN